jgi:uncharacterized protein YndB with AHSA1/START domain
MTKSPPWKPDPALDLVLERVVDVPRDLVWEAWTNPEHVKVWFTPRPWRTTACEIDLRPGGFFRTIMQGPAGEMSDNVGCYLEVIPKERLVWTDTLLPGWRPADSARLGFTAVIALETLGQGTRYTATALHRDEAGRRQHEDMGFHNGWGAALDQLVAHVKTTLQRGSLPS